MGLFRDKTVLSAEVGHFWLSHYFYLQVIA
jgi:hypothetical protein